jgi:hypothetical protein
MISSAWRMWASGNMHEMFLDKNSDEIIKFIDDWIRRNIK